MKQLLLPILTSLILTAPCLNAGLDSLTKLLLGPITGNYGLSRSEKFDNRTCALAGAPALKITKNILSADADNIPDQEYIDELAKMIEVRKKDTRLAQRAVILLNADLSKASYTAGQATGTANNRPDTHSIIKIDQKIFEKRCPAYNTHTLAHELGHVIKGHLGTFDYEIDRRKRQELEAEIEAYKTLAECGYYKTINTLRNRTIIQGLLILVPPLTLTLSLATLGILISNGQYQRIGVTNISTVITSLIQSISSSSLYYPKGQYYPNLYEMFVYQTQALNECRNDIDPSTTKDTPKLMRNGSSSGDLS